MIEVIEQAYRAVTYEIVFNVIHLKTERRVRDRTGVSTMTELG